MSYLLSQIWMCLFLVALVAGLAGWLLARSGNKQLSQSVKTYKKDLVRLKNERDYYASELESGTDLVKIHDQVVDVEEDTDMANISHADLVKQLSAERYLNEDLKDKIEAQQQLFAQRVAELEAGSQLAQTEIEDYSHQLVELQAELKQHRKALSEDELPELAIDKKNVANETHSVMDLSSKPVSSMKLEFNGVSHAVDVLTGPSATVLKKLSKMGVKQTSHLLEKAYDLESIIVMAEKLGEEPWNVRSWVSSADLLRIKGLTPVNAELLEFAGVGRVQELQRANLKKLVASMRVINRHVNKTSGLPDLEEVTHWVSLAGKLGPAVSANIDQI